MSLEDYRAYMESCRRCSPCKFIPLEKVKGVKNTYVCPSISRYNFHTYSGGGRMAFQLAMLNKRVPYSAQILEVVYNCQMCGACDISCKYDMDMEVLEPINEFRIKCVEDGQTLPAIDNVIDGLRKQGTMVPASKAKRGMWAEGLEVKDFTKQRTEVIFHAGCRTCADEDLWKVARATVSLMQKAGVDIGIASNGELCCGGRAYQMGYKEDFLRQAKMNMELFKKTGAKTLVTGCADCYYTFKVLCDQFNMKGPLEVLHTTEYFDRLIKNGKLQPAKTVALNVTYQDPCHLGRLGEAYKHWEGKEIIGAVRMFDPPKEYRRGTYGIYTPPRDVLKSIPGINLVEMDRIKEYSWCCGAGGGVKESNSEFAKWTARERLVEAVSSGAEAIITACPGCQQSFRENIKENGTRLKVLDVVELLEKSI
jgi:Fe-S oxidoreductase